MKIYLHINYLLTVFSNMLVEGTANPFPGKDVNHENKKINENINRFCETLLDLEKKANEFNLFNITLSIHNLIKERPKCHECLQFELALKTRTDVLNIHLTYNKYICEYTHVYEMAKYIFKKDEEKNACDLESIQTFDDFYIILNLFIDYSRNFYSYFRNKIDGENKCYQNLLDESARKIKDAYKKLEEYEPQINIKDKNGKKNYIYNHLAKSRVLFIKLHEEIFSLMNFFYCYCCCIRTKELSDVLAFKSLFIQTIESYDAIMHAVLYRENLDVMYGTYFLWSSKLLSG